MLTPTDMSRPHLMPGPGTYHSTIDKAIGRTPRKRKRDVFCALASCICRNTQYAAKLRLIGNQFERVARAYRLVTSAL